MEFSRLFKSIYIFAFLSFSSGVAMQSPTIDSIGEIKNELANYLFLAQNAEGRLIHEGVSSLFGKSALIDMLGTPAGNLTELKKRQAILKELVSLTDKEFTYLVMSFKELVPDFDLFPKLHNEIQDKERRLAFLKENMFKFFNGQSNGVMLDALSYASSVLTTLMTCAKGQALFVASGGFGAPFVMSLMMSIFLGAMYQYIMGISVSSMIPAYILQNQFTGGHEQFLCGEFIAEPITEAAIKELTQAGCKSTKSVGSLIPDFFKTSAGKVMSGFSAVGNFTSTLPVISPVITHVSSYAPWTNSSMFLGGGLLDLLHMDRLILYIKYSHELNGKKKKLEDLRAQLTRQLGEFSKKIKELHVSCESKNFEKLDVYFGLASLIRESRKQESGSTRFKFGFVDFIEPDQTENTSAENGSEMSIKNFCHFFKFKPHDAYRTANVFSNDYIFPELNLCISKDNQISINSKVWEQSKFVNSIKPFYAQMLLAYTFGIVWGENAHMHLRFQKAFQCFLLSHIPIL